MRNRERRQSAFVAILHAAAIAVVAWVFALAVTLGVAALTSRPAIFLGAGAVVGAGAWFVLTRRGTRRGPRSRPVVRWVAGAIVGALAVGSVVIPVDDLVVPPTTPPGAASWVLADGSTIAFGVIRARRPTGAPVVIVHGGPGVPELAADLDALRVLADRGHDVYAYARPGSGGSTRLAAPMGYTVGRDVEVLEQVRQRIGARRLILVGHSEGAFVVASYLATHPNRVRAVVFTSPGSLDDGLSGSAVTDALTLRERLQAYALLMRPRLLIAYALLQVNADAAHAFAGDAELDARQDRVVAATNPAQHCRGLAGPVVHGTGFYANQVPQSWHRPPVPAVRSQLAVVDVPALVMRGTCDYIDRGTAADYATTIPGARLVDVDGAGHDIKADQPATYLRLIDDFLDR